MLQVKQMSKVYEGKIPYRALSNIDITIKKGEFVGVIGPSGSGKTTLLNVISTIDEPTGNLNSKDVKRCYGNVNVNE